MGTGRDGVNGSYPNRDDRLVVVEQFVCVVQGFVVPTEHVVIEYAVRLRVQSGGHGEVVDERLRGENAPHERRRRRLCSELGHLRRGVGPYVVGTETVERHDQRRRVVAGDRSRRSRRGDDYDAQGDRRHVIYCCAPAERFAGHIDEK